MEVPFAACKGGGGGRTLYLVSLKPRWRDNGNLRTCIYQESTPGVDVCNKKLRIKRASSCRCYCWPALAFPWFLLRWAMYLGQCGRHFLAFSPYCVYLCLRVDRMTSFWEATHLLVPSAWKSLSASRARAR